MRISDWSSDVCSSDLRDCYFDLDDIRVPQKWQNKKHFRGDKKGELSCNPDGKNPGDVWAFQNVKHHHEEQQIHPAQFPAGLVARIVLAPTSAAGSVLHQYMDCGTTPADTPPKCGHSLPPH